jgi:hypothetical protein
MASDSDAEEELPGWGLRLMNRSNQTDLISGEFQVQDVTMPDLPNAILTEHAITGSLGVVTMRTVRGNVDRFLFAIGCGSLEGGWPWEDVFCVADLQSAKIREAVRISH